jgi:DNA-binding XRE family transcriptional regulator
MNGGNVFPLGEERLPRSLYGRPTRKGYRAAIAQVIRDVKARHSLSNEGLADEIGCHKDTVANAEDEVGNLDPVTLLNIAYVFGEQAIEPVRQLYLCSPPEPLSTDDRIARIRSDLAEIERERCAIKKRIEAGDIVFPFREGEE